MAIDAAGLPCFCRRINKNKNGFATETKLKKNNLSVVLYISLVRTNNEVAKSSFNLIIFDNT